MKKINHLLDRVARVVLEERLQMSEACLLFRNAMIRVALRNTDGHRIQAAKLLGIHRNSLNRNSHFDLGSEFPRWQGRRVTK
jgi:transcriptional regulator with PAS, ATPase and Fis domain